MLRSIQVPVQILIVLADLGEAPIERSFTDCTKDDSLAPQYNSDDGEENIDKGNEGMPSCDQGRMHDLHCRTSSQVHLSKTLTSESLCLWLRFSI